MRKKETWTVNFHIYLCLRISDQNKSPKRTNMPSFNHTYYYVVNLHVLTQLKVA